MLSNFVFVLVLVLLLVLDIVSKTEYEDEKQ
jgi:hypothetical protein